MKAHSAVSKIDLFKKAVYCVCPEFQVTNENKQLLNDLYAYCNAENGKYNPTKGIWLWGSIGTGKSTLLKIIEKYDSFLHPLELTHDSVRNHWHRNSGGFVISNSTKIAMDFSDRGICILEYLTYNNGKPLTIGFDEVGREPIPVRNFGTELNIMQYIIQARYELLSECKTHVTTNLSLEGIHKLYDYYVADRVKEMFNVIELKGKSFRK